MRRQTVLIFLIGISTLNLPARNLDSLWGVWKNESVSDSARFSALFDYSWEGYLYSQPDSAFFFADMLHDEALKKDQPDWVARALNLQGNSWIIRGDYFSAFKCFHASLAISNRTGNGKNQANSLHSIGIIYYYEGEYARAIQYYMQSLKIRETIKDPEGISKSLNNIGIVYSEQEKYDNALDFFTRSLALSRERNDRRGEASSLNNMGLIYKSKNLTDSAYTYYHRSMEISEALGDRRDVAVGLNNLGQLLQENGEPNKALEHYKKSLAISEDIGDKRSIALTYINIGTAYDVLKRHADAVAYCRKGLDAATQVGSLSHQESACNCLYKNYKALGNRQLALEFHEQMHVIADSIKDAETLEALQHMEFTRQVFADSVARADEQGRIQRAHAETIRKKNQTRNIFIVATLLLLIGAVSLFNRIRYIRKSRTEISREKERSDNLLLNILPGDIAKELKENGRATPRKFENVTILFTDFKDFTQQSSRLSPEELISELNACFMDFDAITELYHLEKIKTIGDAYMVVGGLPVAGDDTAKNTVLAAIEMTAFMEQRRKQKESEGKFSFEIRAGIHTGTVVAGIVGKKKFQYDIYGDTVNVASRMENAAEPGKVNISKTTYEQIKNDPQFQFRHRGELMVKGKGCTEMYYVTDVTNLRMGYESTHYE